jgi:hypothetical protein
MHAHDQSRLPPLGDPLGGLNGYEFVTACVLLRVFASETSLHSETHLPQVALVRPLAVSGSDECFRQGFSTHGVNWNSGLWPGNTCESRLLPKGAMIQLGEITVV